MSRMQRRPRARGCDPRYSRRVTVQRREATVSMRIARVMAFLMAGGLAAGACGSAPARRGSPENGLSSPTSGPGAPPLPVGRAVVGDTGLGEAVVLDDDRTLVVEATFGCGGPPKLVAQVEKATVELRLVTATVAAGTVCATVLGFGPVTTTLSVPLGDRRLVTSTDAPIVEVRQAELVAPRYLPGGYRLRIVVPGVRVPVGSAVSAPCATELYVDPEGSGAPVAIAECLGAAMPRPPVGWSVLPPATIGGAAALVAEVSSAGSVYGRSITWSAGGNGLVVETGLAGNGKQVPGEPALVAVANHLH
jgi:hypothetical protein